MDETITKAELIEFLKMNLAIEAKVDNGSLEGVLTITLKLGDLVVSQTDVCTDEITNNNGMDRY